jgi:hypothetical protein
MSPRHRILPAVVAFALGLGLALPLAARGAVPVGLYPVQSEGLTDAERGEVQAVVESALLGADRRGVLEPRSPLVVVGSCKAPITVGCVATLAKGGVVLYAKARRRGAAINVTILFVDATGRKTRALAFPVDPFIQNLRPANDAIATLEGDLAAGVLEDPAPPPPPPGMARTEPERPAPRPAAPPQRDEPERAAAPPPEPARAAPPPPQRAEPAEPAVVPRATQPIDLTPLPKAKPAPSARTAKKAAARDVVPEPPAGSWKQTAGNWCTGGGVALLVAGAAVGLSGKRLADSLQERFENRTLRPEDDRLYDRVARYEAIANGLFIAGGVALTAGVTFHGMAPSGGGAGVALAGSF